MSDPRNPSPTHGKHYLGDGVYVAFNEARQIVLTAEDGIRATDIIYLEPTIYKALQLYVSRYLRDFQG